MHELANWIPLPQNELLLKENSQKKKAKRLLWVRSIIKQTTLT